MLLRFHKGKDYADVLDNPAKTVQEIRARKEQKRDIKAIRKTFHTLMNLIDDNDLEGEERSLVLRGFHNVLECLPEAQGVLDLRFKTAEEDS